MKENLSQYKEKFNPYNTKGTVVFGRVRRFFLGKNTPALFTRITCNIAILYFFYVFLYALTMLLAFKFGKNLPQGPHWEKLFEGIGQKYGITNINLSYTLYLLTLIVFSVTSFLSTMFVWRKRINGYIPVIASAVICAFSAFIFLGMDYVKAETGWWEYAFGGLVIVLFTIDFILQKRLANK
ncbi:MAG TPA: hypothetical protein VD905_01825 [Flavobacteriales bacterium]|nr:hypothetical protein [Flavobacteriales bacterium]